MEPVECYQCGEVLTEEYWSNYYSCESSDENILCGDGNCWAEWMQDNTHSHTIEGDTDE